jgi:hypothetical protein
MMKIDYCDLSASYMPEKHFDGLAPFQNGAGWLPLGIPVMCTADITIGGSGGAGNSAWSDSVTVTAGDTVILTRIGNPATPARVRIIRQEQKK